MRSSLTSIIVVALFCCLSTITAWAQPPLGLPSLPAPSQSIPLLICDTTGVIPGPRGIDVTWNFSTLRRRAQLPDSLRLRYAAIEEMPPTVRDSFPTADVVVIEDTTSTFYDTQAGFFKVLGVTTPTMHIASSPADPYDSRPIEIVMNTPFSDTWRSVVYSGQTVVVPNRIGSHKIEYDGFGTLILPNQTFAGVARTTDSSTIVDTIRQGPIVIVSTTRTTRSVWQLPTDNFPLLVIQSTVNTRTRNGTPLGQPFRTKTVHTVPFTVQTSVDDERIHSFGVTPQPVTGNSVNIGPLDGIPINILLCDAQGACTTPASFTTNESGVCTVQLPDVASGFYTLVVEFEGDRSQKRIQAAPIIISR